MDVITKGNLGLKLHQFPHADEYVHKAVEQNHRYISDFKVSTKHADVGRDAFSQTTSGLKERKNC